VIVDTRESPAELRLWRPLLATIVVLLPPLGLLTPPGTFWAISLVIALFVLLFFSSKIAFRASLALQWLVQIEPPAVDLLTTGALLKRIFAAKHMQFFKPDLALLPFLLFSFVNILQLPFASDSNRALLFGAITIYTTLLMPYIFSNIEQYAGNTWIKCLAASMYITAVSLIVFGVLGLLGYKFYFPHFFDGIRPTAFFKDPNVAAPFVIFGALRYLTLYSLGQIQLKYFLPRFTLFLLAILFTFSRGAFINLFVGALFVIAVAITTKHVKRSLTIFAIVLLIFSISAVAAIALGQNRFLSINDYDTSGRLAAWISGLLVFHDYPFGVGPGQFESFSAQVQIQELRNKYITPSAHNVYIRVLVENGIEGLMLWLVGIMFVMIKGVRALITSYLIRNYSKLIGLLWSLSTLIGILVEGMVIDILHWRHLGMVIGLVLLYSRDSQKYV